MKTLKNARCHGRNSRSESQEFSTEIITQKPLLYGSLIFAPIISIFLMRLNTIEQYKEAYIYFNVGLFIALTCIILVVGQIFKYYKKAEYKMWFISLLSIIYWFIILQFDKFKILFDSKTNLDIVVIVLSLLSIIAILLILIMGFGVIFYILNRGIGSEDNKLLRSIFGECKIRLLYFGLLSGILLPLSIMYVFDASFINTGYMAFHIAFLYYMVFVLFSLHENIPDSILLREQRGIYIEHVGKE